MATATVPGYDCTRAGIGHLPADAKAVAGYITGSGDIPWTPADWEKYPAAVRIDQSPAHTLWDAAADVQDYERGAVTLAELAPRAKVMLASYHAGARPGQRQPAIYVSRANVHDVANALVAGGVTSGVGLFVADWDGNRAAAEAEVAAGSGPYPVIGRQWKSAGPYDEDIFSERWLNTVSAVKPPPPPGQWDGAHAWTWKEVVTGGIGADGKLHLFRLDGGQWGKLQ